jgi:hypothetical protein
MTKYIPNLGRHFKRTWWSQIKIFAECNTTLWKNFKRWKNIFLSKWFAIFNRFLVKKKYPNLLTHKHIDVNCLIQNVSPIIWFIVYESQYTSFKNSNHFLWKNWNTEEMKRSSLLSVSCDTNRILIVTFSKREPIVILISLSVILKLGLLWSFYIAIWQLHLSQK